MSETVKSKPSAAREGLPQEILPQASSHKVLRDLLAALLLLLVFNIAAYFFLGFYTSNYGFWVVKNKWRLLTSLEQPVDWLVLGDSSANQGVIPSILAQEGGKSSINLGTIGDMILVEKVMMLEYYLEHHPPPEKVIIVYVPDMWHRGFNPVLLSQIPRPWGYWDEHSITGELLVEGWERDIFIERYLPLYTQNRSLRQIIYTSMTKLRSPFDNGYRLDPYGYFPAERSAPERVVLGAQDYKRFAEENSFLISHQNQLALEYLVKLAEENQFDIYLVPSPTYEGLRHEQSFQNFLGEMHRQLSEISTSSPYLHSITEVSYFPAGVMQNPDHLTQPGAVVYTRWLMNALMDGK
jgi:hypothetical protein